VLISQTVQLRLLPVSSKLEVTDKTSAVAGRSISFDLLLKWAGLTGITPEN
jgi:hypothetical protein